MKRNWKKRTAKPKPRLVAVLIKRAEKWDKKYLDLTLHALELYDRDDCDDLAHAFLSKKARGEFKLTNPYSKQLWLPALMEAFLSDRRSRYGKEWWDEWQRSKVAVAHVTITDRSWACADTNIKFDLRKAKQKVRNALAGAHFIAHFEAAVYLNERWETEGMEGKLISFHCHAIVWIGSESTFRRLQRKICRRFKPLLGKKSGVHAQVLRSAASVRCALAYDAKLPTLGYRTYVNKKGKKRQKHAPMTYSSRRNLFHALKDRSMFEFSVGGGEGGKILKNARDPLVRKYRERQRRRDRRRDV